MSKLCQREAFAAELRNISPDITAKDKASAITCLGIKSKSTISSYLRGEVRDNDTAARLITFFKARIQKRNEVLA